MAARPHVPEFGNWESQDNVPYTVYFDKARKGKGRGGKMINPNDPQENPEMFTETAPSPPVASIPPPYGVRAQGEEVNGRGGYVRPHHEPRVSREDGNFRQYPESPARSDNLSRRSQAEEVNGRGGGMVRPHHEPRVSKEDGNFRPYADSARNDNLGRRTCGESVHQHSSHGSSRPPRQSAGSDYSLERSPLHQHQARLTARGSASPAWDPKNSYDSSHGSSAPGKPRKKPIARGDESPDTSAAVPKFGDWDEKNPQSADNYTHIFNKVREERHGEPGNVGAGSQLRSPYRSAQNPNVDAKRKGGCFPCLGI